MQTRQTHVIAPSMRAVVARRQASVGVKETKRKKEDVALALLVNAVVEKAFNSHNNSTVDNSYIVMGRWMEYLLPVELRRVCRFGIYVSRASRVREIAHCGWLAPRSPFSSTAPQDIYERQGSTPGKRSYYNSNSK